MSEPGRSADVRLATWADRAAVAALRHAWTEERDGHHIEDDGFLARFDAWLEREQDQRLTWLGFVAHEPAGMLNMLVFTRMPRPGHLDPSVWGYVANVYVAPAHRGTGLGTRMLEACTTYADEHGFVRIVLSPTERSIPLYVRAGFGPATELIVRERP